ncbi:hypothetical protein [Dickeya aquatica]|uniref:hypothetical protein n=1 Tax=Dickeya aquatica TaxID=1401087 RepID=UPI00054D79C2|nr:hypothetical protein [Dickeya aquatica]
MQVGATVASPLMLQCPPDKVKAQSGLRAAHQPSHSSGSALAGDVFALFYGYPIDVLIARVSWCAVPLWPE